MKCVISRQELNDALQRVQNIVAPKTPIPILSHLLLEAHDGQLVLTATDLTVAVRFRVPAKVVTPGAVTLPARRFAQLVRESMASHLEISSAAPQLVHIVATGSSFRIPGLPRDDFPQLPDLSDATQLRFRQSDLKEALFRTAFTVSKEESRYVLTAVCCHVQPKGALFVGTDGKRLSRVFISHPEELSVQLPESIIPLKAVEEMIKNLIRDEEPVSLAVTPDKIAIETEDFLIISKLLSGDYPDVDRVIPLQSTHVLALPREELISLLRQVSLFIADPMNSSIRVTLNPGEFTLSANTMDLGEGKVSMPIQYTGDRLDIALNPNSLVQILQHSRSESVCAGFTDAYNPIIIADGTFGTKLTSLPDQLFVLMPMRLNNDAA